MEKKMKAKQHNKHGHQPHRPLDAYELYELEHMPQRLVKTPSDRPEPRAHEAFGPDYYEAGREMQPHWHPTRGGNGEVFRPAYYETGREMQPHWRPTGGGNGKIFRPDYYEMAAQPYRRPPEDDDGGISKENIDAEAESFIQWEHEKFELSKWMSRNSN